MENQILSNHSIFKPRYSKKRPRASLFTHLAGSTLPRRHIKYKEKFWTNYGSNIFVFFLVIANFTISGSVESIYRDNFKVIFIKISLPLKVTATNPSLPQNSKWRDSELYIWSLFIPNEQEKQSNIDNINISSNSVTITFFIGKKDSITQTTTSEDLLKLITTNEVLLISSGSNTSALNFKTKFSSIVHDRTIRNITTPLIDTSIKYSRFNGTVYIEHISFRIEKIKLAMVIPSTGIFNKTDGFSSWDWAVISNRPFTEKLFFKNMTNINAEEMHDIDNFIKSINFFRTFICLIVIIIILIIVIISGVYWVTMDPVSKEVISGGTYKSFYCSDSIGKKSN